MLLLQITWHPGQLCMALVCLLCLWDVGSTIKGESKKEKGVAFLATTELPAKTVDLSTVNLTELVNGMLTKALKGDSKKFFSLLSITSHSSFAFHKFSVVIYNISNLKIMDPTKFPTRYCYCLNNRTNDLSDFTALLVDIIGNSTSYLTEIFKSTSILSVSQSTELDCIYICVMTGKTGETVGRNLSDFWEMVEKSPVINYTFTSNVSGVLATRMTTWAQSESLKRPEVTATKFPSWTQTMKWEGSGISSTKVSSLIQNGLSDEDEIPHTRTPQRLPSLTRVMITQGTSSHAYLTSVLSSSPSSMTLTPSKKGEDTTNEFFLSGTDTPGTNTPGPTKAPAPKPPHTVDFGPALISPSQNQSSPFPKIYIVSRCPQPLLKDKEMTTFPLTLSLQKINPCVMELCRYFQQCLCISQEQYSRKDTMRFCIEYYSWFLRSATYICQRVTRMAHSHTLKQKCLSNICTSV
ncbi:HERV-H LTR-associating protein 1 [Dromiciops gliroides]|uniref:HERV-H LTR-associating protein 1 n=1 Tax=Dromiciops gliroides TaxID=33562 RepID=UPI001CC7AEFB|nr:HERV-H LTR-associating protein 1 [Dromiciops gliroides]